MHFFYYIPYNIDLLKITCNHFILGSYISQISVFYNQPLLCQWALPFTASVPDFSRYICSSISPSFSFYLSIPPFFFSFTSSLLHFLNSKSIHPFPCTTLPPFISSCFQLIASVSVTVLVRGRLCTQRFVCSGSPSLHTAASSIIKCNGTFTYTAERR